MRRCNEGTADAMETPPEERRTEGVVARKMAALRGCLPKSLLVELRSWRCGFLISAVVYIEKVIRV